MPPALTNELLQEIRAVFEGCRPFRTAEMVKTLFDDKRLHQWRFRVPEAKTEDERMEQIRAWLYNLTDIDGRNGLVLLLDVLREKESVGDSCQQAYERLADKVEIHVKPVAPAKPARQVPWQLPRVAEHFVGREDVLAELHRCLAEGKRVLLRGAGGIGKSALVAQALHELAEQGVLRGRYPDGIIHYDFDTDPSTYNVLTHIAHSYGLEVGKDAEGVAIAALRNKKALVILEAAEQNDEIPRLLNICYPAMVVVTSRRYDRLPEMIDLELLGLAEAVALLQKWGGAYARDGEACAQIAELVGRLPLALEIGGNHLRAYKQEAADFAVELAEGPLEALTDSDVRGQESVEILLAKSVKQVGKVAERILAIAGLLAYAPFTAEMVSRGSGKDLTTTRKAIRTLLDYNLCVPAGKINKENAYQITHMLIHEYMRRQLDARASEVTRLGRYYRDYVKKQSALGPVGYAALNEQKVHILIVLNNLEYHGKWPEIQSLVDRLDEYLDLQGHFADRIVVNELGRRAIKARHRGFNDGVYLNRIGQAYTALGEIEQGKHYYEQTLDLSQKTHNRQGQGAALGSLGYAYRQLGNVEKGIEYYEQALLFLQEMGDRQGEESGLGHLGGAYRELGEVEKGITYYERALLISQEIGDRRGEGVHLGNLGLAYHDLGEVEKGITYYERALLISQEIGNRQGEGYYLGNLGDACRELEEIETALEKASRGLVVVQEIGSRSLESYNYNILANIYRDMGDLETALGHHERAIALAEDLKLALWIGRYYGALGQTYLTFQNYELARLHLTQGLESAVKHGEKLYVARWRWQLAQLALAEGDVVGAREYAEVSLAFWRGVTVGHPLVEEIEGWLAGVG
ncbi:MAG TPA: tetratricopeptide repeat protein [Anaerolineae bacterium]|nr:tetratricopeptide repeat protein [Anaerolineae bacterium]